MANFYMQALQYIGTVLTNEQLEILHERLQIDSNGKVTTHKKILKYINFSNIQGCVFGIFGISAAAYSS